MIAGTVGAMADGDAVRYAQIASLAGFTMAALCLIAWLLRLSTLVTLISDSILVGFKAGAGLTIALTQLPSLLGVPAAAIILSSGCCSLPASSARASPRARRRHWRRALLLAGERLLPGRPIALGVVMSQSCWPRSWDCRPGGADHRKYPIRPAGVARAVAAHTGCGRYRAAGHRLPAARLYRERLRGARLCQQSMAMRSIPARSCWASARPISVQPSGRVIPSPADCRNRR